MMQKLKSALVGALLLWTPYAANAAEKIQLDPGGSLWTYAEKFVNIRNLEGKVQIDGLCISACTLVTAFVPPKNVCATEIGKLAFHSASTMGPFMTRLHSKEGTRLLWALYPKAVQDALITKGWDGSDGAEHDDLIYLDASMFYEPCKER